MAFLTDIEIAQRCTLKPIGEVAKAAGIPAEGLEPYGRYKAKVDTHFLDGEKKNGKLILVTAINPTPAGEGKTTTTIGLTDALRQLAAWVPFSGSKAARPAAAMHRSFRWRISTFTLPVISMRSALQTICLPLCWTTTFNRGMRSALT